MRLSNAAAIVSAIFLVLVFTGGVWGFEVTAGYQMGNLEFADDRASSATDYPIKYPFGLSLYGSQPISDILRVDTGFFYDPTLKNISYTLLKYTQQYFTLGVGPFFGFFNSPTDLLRPGISTAVRVDFPGIAFLEFRSDSTIGGRMVQTGDYLQERSDITAGMYVLNAIATVNLLTKSYTYRTETEEIIDSFVEYSFTTDIYQKNVPFKILLSFAYQKRGKSFTNVITNVQSVHELNSLILGTQIDFQITDYMSFMLSLDSSIYSFGSANNVLLALPTSGAGAFLFNAGTGITLDIDRIADRQRIP